jgi:hypothetical protein
MSAATAAPVDVRPFTARLLDLVRDLAGHTLDLRSRDGFRHQQARLPEPVTVLPPFVLSWLEDQDHIRIVTAPPPLRVAVAYWKLGDEFTRETEWRHRVPAADQARVRAALAGFPIQPAWLVTAGPEVVAGWRLAEPLPAADALAVFERLAQRLGATWPWPPTVPLAGVIRNWNETHRERVELVDVAPDQTITRAALERALDGGGS